MLRSSTCIDNNNYLTLGKKKQRFSDCFRLKSYADNKIQSILISWKCMGMIFSDQKV